MIDDEWDEIGYFGVDAGLCWIGDPGYIIQKEYQDSEGNLHVAPRDKNLGVTWHDFCDRLNEFAVVTDEEKEKVKKKYKKCAKTYKELGIPDRNNPYHKEPQDYEYVGASQYSIFPHEAGHPGLGICISTGGDGIFPVYAKRDANGQIQEVRIKFF